MKVDLILKNANIFNSYYKKFHTGRVAILNGKIFCIDKNNSYELEAKEEFDCRGQFLIPGLIDIHMHIESSMTTPEIFTSEVKKYGVTTIVEEPHEIANVAGKAGIEEFINSSSNHSIDIFYGIPSSVPSTNVELETTGAILNCDDMIEISNMDKVICVGEVMNYRGVIKDDTLEIVKFLSYVREKRKDLVIEGHCPRLTGVELSKFLFLGIDADHTEHSFDEIKEHFENGMFVELQEKMLKQDVIDHIREYNLYEHVAFVTDDIMPDYFINKGHLNNIIRKAISMGFGVCEAIYCATMTAARRMRLYDRGIIATGKIADMVLLENLESFNIKNTFKSGKLIYSEEQKNEFIAGSGDFSEELYNSIKLDLLKEDDFIIKAEEDRKCICRVIEINDGGTLTKEVHKEFEVKDGKLVLGDSGCVFVAVFERYGKNGARGYGLATGDIIKKGAIATTYAHDCHNLLVVGDKVSDMKIAANKVIKNQGGIVAVDNGEILSDIKLNVGGILSEEPMNILGTKIKDLRDVIYDLGYRHYNPIMSLCTLTLPVSPDLKITDKGLINVKEGKITSLFV